MDLHADLLVTPSRSLLVDSVGRHQLERVNGIWSGVSSLGRCAGLLLTGVPLHDYPPFSTWRWSHLQAT